MTLEVGAALRNHAFCRGLSEQQLDSLAALAGEASFRENEVILEEGQRSASFYLLLSGSVTVELRTPQYAISVQALEPGSVFGWSALLNDQDTLFRVRAREATTALRINGAALQNSCRKDPALGFEILYRILKVVAGRVRSTEMRFAEMCGVRL